MLNESVHQLDRVDDEATNAQASGVAHGERQIRGNHQNGRQHRQEIVRIDDAMVKTRHQCNKQRKVHQSNYERRRYLEISNFQRRVSVKAYEPHHRLRSFEESHLLTQETRIALERRLVCLHSTQSIRYLYLGWAADSF